MSADDPAPPPASRAFVRPAKVFVALGSNQGDRSTHLRAGVLALAAIAHDGVVAVSPVYETEPVGPPQGVYLNAVAGLATNLSPRALLEALLEAETRAGRRRDPAERNAPRTLDLDLLLYGELEIDEPGLQVPHPRLHERAFVLIPLADLAPDLVHPRCGRTIASLAASHAGDPAVRRFGASLTAEPS